MILATHGKHKFYEQEAASIRDIRRIPLKFAGYSISYRRGQRTKNGLVDDHWHSHVEIQRRRYLEIQAWFLQQAHRLSKDRLALEFYRLPFEPYAPVRRQMLKLLKRVNGVRRKAGKEPLPYQVLPLRRRPVKPFQPRGATANARGELLCEREPAKATVMADWNGKARQGE